MLGALSQNVATVVNGVATFATVAFAKRVPLGARCTPVFYLPGSPSTLPLRSVTVVLVVRSQSGEPVRASFDPRNLDMYAEGISIVAAPRVALAPITVQLRDAEGYFSSCPTQGPAACFVVTVAAESAAADSGMSETIPRLTGTLSKAIDGPTEFFRTGAVTFDDLSFSSSGVTRLVFRIFSSNVAPVITTPPTWTVITGTLRIDSANVGTARVRFEALSSAYSLIRQEYFDDVDNPQQVASDDSDSSVATPLPPIILHVLSSSGELDRQSSEVSVTVDVPPAIGGGAGARAMSMADADSDGVLPASVLLTGQTQYFASRGVVVVDGLKLVGTGGLVRLRFTVGSEGRPNGAAGQQLTSGVLHVVRAPAVATSNSPPTILDLPPWYAASGNRMVPNPLYDRLSTIEWRLTSATRLELPRTVTVNARVLLLDRSTSAAFAFTPGVSRMFLSSAGVSLSPGLGGGALVMGDTASFASISFDFSVNTTNRRSFDVRICISGQSTTVPCIVRTLVAFKAPTGTAFTPNGPLFVTVEMSLVRGTDPTTSAVAAAAPTATSDRLPQFARIGFNDTVTPVVSVRDSTGALVPLTSLPPRANVSMISCNALPIVPPVWSGAASSTLWTAMRLTDTASVTAAATAPPGSSWTVSVPSATLVQVPLVASPGVNGSGGGGAFATFPKFSVDPYSTAQESLLYASFAADFSSASLKPRMAVSSVGLDYQLPANARLVPGAVGPLVIQVVTSAASPTRSPSTVSRALENFNVALWIRSLSRFFLTDPSRFHVERVSQSVVLNGATATSSPTVRLEVTIAPPTAAAKTKTPAAVVAFNMLRLVDSCNAPTDLAMRSVFLAGEEPYCDDDYLRDSIESARHCEGFLGRNKRCTCFTPMMHRMGSRCVTDARMLALCDHLSQCQDKTLVSVCGVVTGSTWYFYVAGALFVVTVIAAALLYRRARIGPKTQLRTLDPKQIAIPSTRYDEVLLA